MERFVVTYGLGGTSYVHTLGARPTGASWGGTRDGATEFTYDQVVSRFGIKAFSANSMDSWFKATPAAH